MHDIYRGLKEKRSLSSYSRDASRGPYAERQGDKELSVRTLSCPESQDLGEPITETVKAFSSF